jgi:hypothetical protein
MKLTSTNSSIGLICALKKFFDTNNNVNCALKISPSKKFINFLAKKFFFLKKLNLIFYLVQKINRILSWHLNNKQNKKLKKFFWNRTH